MMNIPALTDLYRHMEWADAAVWTAVLTSERGPTDARLQERLYHLHLAQRAFLDAWRPEPRGTPYPKFEEAHSLLLWGRTYYGEAVAFLETLSEEKASEPLKLPWTETVEPRIGPSRQETTVGETVLQVALHSLYHRGQINARLREVGGEPPLVDYIAWIWLGRPAPDWPALAP